MQLLIDIPTDGEARLTEAFCTGRQQDGESEEDCILRLVSDYVNSVVNDYERTKTIQQAVEAAIVAPSVAAPASADLREQVAQLAVTSEEATAVTSEAPAAPATLA